MADLTPDALAAIEARDALADVAHDVVFHAMLSHPLPWRVERDWTHEVTAADGTILAKCMTHARASAVIAPAERIRTEVDAADVCIYVPPQPGGSDA